MLPEPSTLVRLVMETLGAKGPTALARELGLRDYGAPRKIGDWLDGKYAPNYEMTMLMLQRAGLLNLEASTPRRMAAALAPLSARQRYLLAAADDGLAARELASVFNAPEDEIQTELDSAREELASWEETHGEEVRLYTPDISIEEAAKHLAQIRARPRTYEEALSRLLAGESSEPAPETPESWLERFHYLMSTAPNVELAKRVETLEQQMRELRPDTE